MMGISTKDFIEGYKQANSKEEYISSILSKDYVPVEYRIVYAEQIAKQTMTDKETGRIKVNSLNRMVLFRLRAISMFTKIDVNFKNLIEEYNALDSEGLIEATLAAIPSQLIGEFSDMVSRACDDVMTNKYDIHAYADEVIEQFSTVAKLFLVPLAKKIETIDIPLDALVGGINGNNKKDENSETKSED